jgi:osmoprotectant transport system substrate-binding protein
VTPFPDRPARRLLPAAAAVVVLAAALALLLPAPPAGACVGRTIYVGHFDSPEQLLVANLLAVFIDERTGTTVKLQPFASREEAYEAIRKDKVSLLVDHSSVVLRKLAGETPGPDEGKNLSLLKESLSRKYNVVWVDTVGYDRWFSPKASEGKPGPAGVLLCKDALAKFPALPKLIAKLRGVLDNDTMAALLKEAQGNNDPKGTARRFLKSRKLV